MADNSQQMSFNIGLAKGQTEVIICSLMILNSMSYHDDH